MTQASLDLPIPIEELKQMLRDNGVIAASVFGSYARGEATPDSDLDLFVELAPHKTYLDLGSLQYKLEQRTAKRIDLATKLNHRFEPYITPDLVKIL